MYEVHNKFKKEYFVCSKIISWFFESSSLKYNPMFLSCVLFKETGLESLCMYFKYSIYYYDQITWGWFESIFAMYKSCHPIEWLKSFVSVLVPPLMLHETWQITVTVKFVLMSTNQVWHGQIDNLFLHATSKSKH